MYDVTDWPLVGRQRQLEVVDHLVDRLVAGHGSVLWLEAQAGAGKSFLLSRLAERYTDRADTRVAIARAGTATPYAIALELNQVSVRELAGESGSARSFFEAGVTRAADVLAIETLVQRSEQSSRGRPAIWMVDDAHLADAGSLAWIEAIAALDQPPMLLIVATRPPAAGGSLAELSLRIRPAVTELGLGGLGSGEQRQLCAARFGHSPGPRLASVLAETDGSPLLLSAVLENLDLTDVIVADDMIEITDALAERMRVQVPDAVRAHLASVVAGDTLVAAAAALAGSTFRVVDVASVLGVPLAQAIEVITRLERAGVVTATGEHRFRHDHYRLAAIGGVSTPVQQSLHAAYATTYIERGEPALRVVDHLVASGAVGAQAAEWMTRAADDLVRFDPSSALRVADQAAASSPGEPSRRLTTVRARALAAVGRTAEGEALARALLVGATADEEAALRRDLAMASFQQGRAADTVVEMERAVALATSERGRARLRAESAFAYLLAADFATARQVARAGSADGDRLGDLVTVLAAEMVGALVALYQLDLDEAERLADRLERLSELPEASEATVYQPWFAAAMVRTLSGDFEHARRLNATGRQRSAQTGYLWMVPAYDAMDALVALESGDLADVEAIAAGALGWGIEDAFGASLWCRGFAARAAASRGDRVAAAAHIAAGEELLRPGQAQLGWDHLAIAKARLAVLAGEHDRAVAELAPIADAFEAFGIDSPTQDVAVELVRAAALGGDAVTAGRYSEVLVGFAARAGRRAWQVDADYACGLAAGDAGAVQLAAERLGLAGRALDAAVATADAALLADRAGRRSEARRMALPAVDELRRLGAEAEAVRLVHLAGRRGRPPSPKGFGRLSSSERQVVELVAEGLTNSQIAERLFVSRRTVESHVSAVYRKLGTSNRVEIARMIAQRS